MTKDEAEKFTELINKLGKAHITHSVGDSVKLTKLLNECVGILNKYNSLPQLEHKKSKVFKK